MTITPQQLAARRLRIGSSDAAAILGLDPFKSAYDVYLEKTEQVEADSDSEAAAVGNWLEPALCAWAAESFGAAIRQSPETYTAPCGILAANIDAIDASDEPDFFIEAKSTGLADQWGDDGTDQVPPRVVTQTAVAFACVPSLRVAWIPVLIGKHGLRRRLYRLERDDAIVQGVAEACRRFWREHVEAGAPPDGTVPNLDLLARIKREPESCVEIADATLLDRFLAAKAEAKAAAEREDEAKALLIAALGPAESGRTADGRLVTYLQQTRRGIDLPAIKLAHPDFVAKYATTTTFRVLRTKEPKP